MSNKSRDVTFTEQESPCGTQLRRKQLVKLIDETVLNMAIEDNGNGWEEFRRFALFQEAILEHGNIYDIDAKQQNTPDTTHTIYLRYG